MITIGLDEFGHFISSDSSLSLVGGFVYTGDDYDEEKNRLEVFLQEECNKMGVCYPNDMHLNLGGTNRYAVSRFEREIEEPLSRYFRANGKYHLICMVKSRNGRNDYKNISNLLDDTQANNLYEHMVLSLLNNVIFHCLDFIDEDHVRIEIPTRVSVIEGTNSARIREFISLGYSYKVDNKNGSDYYRFFSTDQKTFKTGLSTMVMGSPRKSSLHFDSLNIGPIDYNNANSRMPFLYLSDIVCNWLKRRFDMSAKDYSIATVEHQALMFTGNKPYLWVYDDIDRVYTDIFRKFIDRRLIEVLMDLYDARMSTSDFVDYYRKKWFSMIESNIRLCYDRISIGTYIAQLDRFYLQDNIFYDKGIYVLEKLMDIIRDDYDYIRSDYKYRLADIGVRAYNHKGSTIETNPYVRICEELKDMVPIEEYLGTTTRIVQTHINEFDFKAALEKQKYNLECHDILKEARKDIACLYSADGNSNYRSVPRGRALSSLGQCYAFIGDRTALNCFLEAIEEFGDDKGNAAITYSHLLNHASHMKDRELFEKYSREYFGNYTSITELCHSIFQEERIQPYKLYTCLKALNCIYADELDSAFVEKLKNKILNLKCNTVDHPWELIYKNLGILLYKKNNKDASKIMQKAASCVKRADNTIKAINLFTVIQDYFYSENIKCLEKSIREFEKWLDESPSISKHFSDAFSGNVSEIYRNLENKFTFIFA